MDLRRYDLNLLVTLEALLDEGSVTGAARRLSLSQSAVSAALDRLRAVFADPLLVRTGNLGVKATIRMFETHLATIESLLESCSMVEIDQQKASIGK